MAKMGKILIFVPYVFLCWPLNKNDYSFPVLKYKIIKILRTVKWNSGSYFL
jgi:hypothetical protein